MSGFRQFISNELLPERVTQALLVRRRAPLWLKGGIVFVHVPKAAGTSINHSLYGQFMGHLPAPLIRKVAPVSVTKLPFFSVVRNPWDRCVSAFHFAKKGKGMGQGITAAIYRPEQYNIAEFETFDAFVHEWLATKNVDRLDPVFRSQVHYTGQGEDEFNLDFVGRTENMKALEEYLSDTLQQKISFKKMNFLAIDGRDYRSYYSRETRDLVARIYAKDIAQFGYEF